MSICNIKRVIEKATGYYSTITIKDTDIFLDFSYVAFKRSSWHNCLVLSIKTSISLHVRPDEFLHPKDLTIYKKCLELFCDDLGFQIWEEKDDIFINEPVDLILQRKKPLSNFEEFSDLLSDLLDVLNEVLSI